MVEFILVRTRTPLEIVVGKLENVPWRMLLSNNVNHSYFYQLLECVVVGVDKVLYQHRIDTVGPTYMYLGINDVIKRKSDEAKQSLLIQYLMKNKFLPVQLSPLHNQVGSCRFLHRVNCFSLTIWSRNQQVQESPMEENKTLSLVLPENWHFLRGDIKGFQVQII